MVSKYKIHYFSGLTLSLFVGLHLVNHLAVLISPETHILIMEKLRIIYRNPLVESVLLIVILLQIVSGISLVRAKGLKQSGWDKWQVWSGLYMAFFFVIHVGAVMAGRYVFGLDTNLYFGASGLNVFPLNLFFVPYYSLGIMAFFTHVSSIHYQKTNDKSQAKMIVILGFIVTVLILLGMTNFLRGLEILA